MKKRLRLATYNVHSCVGVDGHYDPDRIAEVLRELDADIIALQEVHSREHRGLELLDHLTSETKLQAIPGPTLLKNTGHFGNALLTRLAVRAVQRLNLSFLHHEPRGAIDADLELGACEVQIIATHLGLEPVERRFQVQRLLERVSRARCALLGDFNEWFLWGRPLRWLRVSFGKTAAPRTFPATLPLFRLDRIWARPRKSIVRVEAHKTTLARLASDHLPVTAIVEWSAVPAQPEAVQQRYGRR